MSNQDKESKIRLLMERIRDLENEEIQLIDKTKKLIKKASKLIRKTK